MKDRNVEFPNRYQLVKVEGTDDVFDIIPAPGEVAEEGTMINKSTLLSDATAALYGLGNTAVPDDVFEKLSASVLMDAVGTPISEQAVGATIKLNETVNGVKSEVEFIVIAHDYPSTGTLVMRKNVFPQQVQFSSTNGVYSGGELDNFLNQTYLSYLDENVRSIIPNASIRVAANTSGSSITTITRKCFALSATEFNFNNPDGTFAAEGTAITYFSSFERRATDGYYHTRSINKNNSTLSKAIVSLTAQFPDEGLTNFEKAGKSTETKARPVFLLPNDYAVNAVISTVDVLGNPITIGTQIVTGSYTGTGTNSVTINFGFTPNIVRLWGTSTTFRGNNTYTPVDFMWGVSTTIGLGSDSNYGCKFTFSDGTLTWTNPNMSNGQYALNSSGSTYYYTAIG